MHMTCYIVDDDPVSRTILHHFVSQVDWLVLKGEFESAHEAIAALQTDAVDLLLLDINMEGMSGIEMAEGLEEKPIIVFTTASREYGPEAFSLNAADYLVKPISQQRFLQAMDGVRAAHQAAKAPQVQDEEAIFVRDLKSLVKLKVQDILYVEALGDYLKLHTAQRFYTQLGTMKQMEEKLKPFGFKRVHRSYLIAIRYINGMEAGQVLVGNYKVPVSETYKPEMMSIINQKKL